jgi:hypothetical protein
MQAAAGMESFTRLRRKEATSSSSKRQTRRKAGAQSHGPGRLALDQVARLPKG